MKTRLILLTFCCGLFIISCQKDGKMNEIPEFALAGGNTTIFDATSNAYSTPAPNLSPENFNKHLEGDLAFEQIFVTPPAEVNPGLGPLFNNNSCVSCHVRNGRSTASLHGDELSGFLIRMSVPGENLIGGPKPVPFYGTQLQTRATFGQEREASFTADEIDHIAQFTDGTTSTLIEPVYQISEPYMPLPSNLLISPRVAPSVFGLGLLEAIPENSLLEYSDEFDDDEDGISGKPNVVWNIDKQAHTIGKFGWKAENPSLLQQTADAFHQDMGITNSFFELETCHDQPNCEDDEIIDVADDVLEVTTFYFQTLAVPAVREYDDISFQRGKEIFEEISCSSCHIPSHTTGEAFIPELSYQKIYPYTDLLLHDMGEGLADNRPSFEANGREWRTPPLWGLGLLPVVNGHSRLLHDGRARSVEEAILWHGGEGEKSKIEYLSLPQNEREDLLQFLNSI